MPSRPLLTQRELLSAAQQEASPDAILIVDENASIVTANTRFLLMWDIPPRLAQAAADEPVLQKVVSQQKDPEAFLRRVRHLYEHRSERSRDELLLKDGRIIDRYSAPLIAENGRYLGRAWFFRDITERKRVESHLQESVARFDQLAEQSHTVVWEVDTDGLYTYVSRSCEHEWGYRQMELVGKMHFYELHPEEGREPFKTAALGVFSQKLAFVNLENPVQTKAGLVKWVSTNGTPVLASDGRLLGYRGSDTDITAHKLAESLQKLALIVFKRLADSDQRGDIIRDILLAVKDSTGMEAAGIRLRSDEDYPYSHTEGFPQEFVEKERSLCARSADGGLVRNASGDVLLECLCGNILSGMTDPSKPFFTRGGSFWTSRASELLSSAALTQGPARMRNRCITSGYESVALIPLRSKERIIGLLQLNDRRKDRLTLPLVEFLEELGVGIGIGIERRTS
jgi:PAS domain S-box-containing protein